MDDSSYLDTIRASIEDNNIVAVLGNDISKVRLSQSEFDNLKYPGRRHYRQPPR